MRPPPSSSAETDALMRDHRRVTEAARRGTREALRVHKLLGNSIAEWRSGRVVIVPPEEIDVDAPLRDLE